MKKRKKKKKRYCTYLIVAREEWSDSMWEEPLCRHQGQWRKRGRRCFGSQSWDSPAAMVTPMVKPMEDSKDAEGLMPGQVDALEEALNTFCGGACFLVGIMTPWVAHARAACPWRTAGLWKSDPGWGSLCRTVTCGMNWH